MLCHTILLPIVILVNVILTIVHEIVKTVCNWVATVIKTVKEIFEKVCSWLPWPLDEICDVFKKVIEAVDIVWGWVCSTVIEAIFEAVNYLLQLIIYVARVICIVVTIIIALPQLLLCLIGVRLPMHIRVSIKVLTDRAGNSAVTPGAVQSSMDTMRAVYRQCGITVDFEGVERIVAPDLLVTPDAWSGFLAPWHAKYSQMAYGCCNQITVFFIDDISGGSNGLTYWGDNWCRVDAGANTDPTIMAHEIGHMCSLTHNDDNDNLMFSDSGPPENPRNTLSGTQCCWMQTSPFITGGGILGLGRG